MLQLVVTWLWAARIQHPYLQENTIHEFSSGDWKLCLRAGPNCLRVYLSLLAKTPYDHC